MTSPAASQIGPGVAGPGVRDHGRHPDGQRQHEPDDGGDRDVRAADADVPGHAVRPVQLRRREAKPDHRELRGGEREQDAEAEERGEEGDLVVDGRGDRDQASRGDDDDRRERRRAR